MSWQETEEWKFQEVAIKVTTLGKLREEELTRASDIFEKAKIKSVCSIVVVDKILEYCVMMCN
jgi:hypothetical protein